MKKFTSIVAKLCAGLVFLLFIFTVLASLFSGEGVLVSETGSVDILASVGIVMLGLATTCAIHEVFHQLPIRRATWAILFFVQVLGTLYLMFEHNRLDATLLETLISGLAFQLPGIFLAAVHFGRSRYAA